MRQTHLFTKTRKEAPADEVSKNAALLIRAGFIYKEMAGVYSILPLGFRVVKKIKDIISAEMAKLGSEELIMSTLQNKEVWEKTNRWSDENVDIWFKSTLKNGTEVGFGWSHEEPITNMMKSHVSSYQDLPRVVHQFQNKLRNETRAKSGILRCREFVMKDMYSYASSEEEHMKFYAQATEAYMNVYKTLGLGDKTYVTSASGGVFTDKFSHEFQTLCEAGEDVIYVHKDGQIALNEEIFSEETLSSLGVKKEDFEMKKTAEVGNIFTFGTKKCEELDLYFTNKEGKRQPAFLGSYGIGVTRLMGVITEVCSDGNSMLWPSSISPFDAHILLLSKDEKVKELADQVYKALRANGSDVLYDDRDLRAGEKFADADLIGIPTRIILGDKILESGLFEVKDRQTEETSHVTLDHLIIKLKK